MDSQSILPLDFTPIVKLAREGNLEAQHICWINYKDCPNVHLLPESLRWYILELFDKAHKENKKLPSEFDLYFKKQTKITRDLKRMINCASVYHFITRWVYHMNRYRELRGVEKLCSRSTIEPFFVELIASKSCSSEDEPKGQELFRRFSTPHKVKHELKYYARNFPRWAFLFENRTLRSIPFSIKTNHNVCA